MKIHQSKIVSFKFCVLTLICFFLFNFLTLIVEASISFDKPCSLLDTFSTQKQFLEISFHLTTVHHSWFIQQEHYSFAT